jgi:alkylhydroperoxidase family enzyme
MGDPHLQVIRDGGAPEGLTPKEQALFHLLRRCNRDYHEITDADVQALLNAGVTYRELVEGIEEVNGASSYNRWAHVLDIGLEGDR